MARATERKAPPQRLILDAGAVIGLSRGDQRARAFVQRAIELDAEVFVPVVVLAETLRGGRADAAVHRVLNAVGNTMPTTAAMGHTAGRLLGRSRRSDTVDALVVAEAVERGGGVVLTGDPDDLTALAATVPDVSIRSLNR